VGYLVKEHFCEGRAYVGQNWAELWHSPLCGPLPKSPSVLLSFCVHTIYRTLVHCPNLNVTSLLSHTFSLVFEERPPFQRGHLPCHPNTHQTLLNKRIIDYSTTTYYYYRVHVCLLMEIDIICFLPSTRTIK
jgi:hypothetical protein